MWKVLERSSKSWLICRHTWDVLSTCTLNAYCAANNVNNVHVFVQLSDVANSRLVYILSKLKKNGVKLNDLILIYKLCILPILEFGEVLWSSGLTLAQAHSLEHIQKRALHNMSCHIMIFLVHLILSHSQKGVTRLSLSLPTTCSPPKDTVTCYHKVDNLYAIIISEIPTILRCPNYLPKNTNNPLFPLWLGWSILRNVLLVLGFILFCVFTFLCNFLMYCTFFVPVNQIFLVLWLFVWYCFSNKPELN